MKKILIAVMLTAVALPTFTFAQSTQGTQAVNASVNATGMSAPWDNTTSGGTQGSYGVQTDTQTSSSRCAVFVRQLTRGTRGNDVTELQKHLVTTGELKMPVGVAYGFYGQATANAVIKYQQKNGLEAVGNVGPRTLQSLKKVLCAGALTGVPDVPKTPPTPTPMPNEFDCPKIVGDFNMDGKVNKADKAIIDAAFNAGGKADCRHGDIDGNKMVDFDDFVLFDKALNQANGVGVCPPSGAMIGDADLDGVIGPKDYTAINTGYYNHLTGWSNGDFDCNNRVDFDDYALIDRAFNTQAPQPSAKIDQSSLTSSSGTPTLTGSAFNVTQFGIAIAGPSGDKVWGSGTIVVTNNRWSVKVTQASTNTGTLTAGTHKVLLYSNNTLIGTEMLVITNPNGYQYPVN